MAEQSSSNEEIVQHALDEVRTWPRLLSFPLAGVAMFCAGRHLPIDHPLAVAAVVMIASCLVVCWGSTLHEAAHHTLSRSRHFNIWFGRLLGSLMFVPYTEYREVHVRHHAYLNRPEDWELWPYADPTRSRMFRRLYAWFDLAFGVISGPCIYGRMFFHRRSPIRNPQLRATIRHEYILMVVIWAAIVGVITWTMSWDKHLVGIFLPIYIGGVMQTARKFTEHLGMSSYDPLLGTRTVLPQRWLIKLASYLTFDIIIHGVHHRHPRAVHSTLEETMQQYVFDNPAQDYPVFDSYLAAMRDMLPHLLFNPGCGMNAGGATPGQLKREDIDEFVTDVTKEILIEEPTRVAAPAAHAS